jgi:hypothetical protein
MRVFKKTQSLTLKCLKLKTEKSKLSPKFILTNYQNKFWDNLKIERTVYT